MKIGLYSAHKLTCISCNLFVIYVILFDFTILVCLLSIQALQSFSTPSIFSSIALLIEEGLSESESNSSSKSEDWGLSTGHVISLGLILSTSLET